ncbi:EF-hand calcium-binding domain-containing protein 9 [Folsomia candida]|uniref:EF-hand calcium-binding domain-containing protein 9 n=1 Tax=Folsomia candida TaxID=158441 RepID=A0A226DZT3_FOLCA|nr:EF-hand calcium-binding domain-containing protein 9 [Folsomia candida]
MKVDCEAINHIHLDPGYALLSVQNTFTSMEMFNILDVHKSERLNDVQFLLLMKNVTNLSNYETEIIFNLLDIDHSGEIEFDEFYLIFCILIACKDSYEKEFIYRHSKSIFQLIDSDGSGEVSADEFGHMGILFNFDMSAIHRIFEEFDVSGDKSLDFTEFRLFTMACIDEARAQAARTKVKAYENYHKRLLNALQPILRRFIRTDCLPVPFEIETTTNKVRLPFARGKRDWAMPFSSTMMAVKFAERREILREYVKHLVGERKCWFACLWLCCCDFCCLRHHEDQVLASCCHFKLKCRCRCCICLMYFFARTFGCCRCCCPCCPCWAHHTKRERNRSLRPVANWDGQERRQANKVKQKHEKIFKQRRKTLKLKRKATAAIAAHIMSPVSSSPIDLLNGIQNKGSEGAEGSEVKGAAGAAPGVLKTGLLGIKPKVLQNVAVTKEVVKSNGIADRAVGTGSVLVDEDEDEAKKKAKAATSGDAPSKQAGDKTEVLSSGLTNVAMLGNSGGKEFKVLPKGGGD